MIKWKLNRKSIIVKLSCFMVFVIFLQSVFIIGTLLLGGVLTQTTDNAFAFFNEKVANRKNYIQNQMDDRWTNIGPYVSNVSKKLSEASHSQNFFVPNNTSEFLLNVAPDLIAMLRTTMATGCYIILDEEIESSGGYSALYFRDYDPSLNDENNNDLFIVKGPSEISKTLQVPMDRTWSYDIILNKSNGDFFYKPLHEAVESDQYKLLGYWSTPFQLSENDEPIITYSVPLLDEEKNVCGVIGIEITIEHLKRYMPASELSAEGSLGYMIGIKNKETGDIVPIILNNAVQNRLVKGSDSLPIHLIQAEKNIYKLKTSNFEGDIYAGVEEFKLYNSNTPFEEEQWVLIGLVQGKYLLEFVNKVKGILFISFFGSILLGMIGVCFAGYNFTKPIISLAKRVRENDAVCLGALGKTGLSEIDDLSSAIESSNQNALDSTLKMSQIINMVNVPLGAFEYNKNSDHVFVTKQLFRVLNIQRQEGEMLVNHKDKFIETLSKIMTMRDPEEENVYFLCDNPKKWIRLQMNESGISTFGVVIDVTDDIEEKYRIKFDRDYDSLTKIYNRAAFYRSVTRLMEEEPHLMEVAAFAMFDLDNLKKINDTYGHAWGDIYIKQTAQLLSDYMGQSAIVGRMSGDEFYVFFYGFQNKSAIMDLISGFYECLKNNKIILPKGNEVEIEISSGIAWYGEDSLSYDELVAFADFAMYEVKSTHKGGVCVFSRDDYDKKYLES